MVKLIMDREFLCGVNNIDYAGIAFNKFPIELADEMRLLWFNSYIGEYRDFVRKFGIFGYVADNSVRYHKPVFLGETVTVQTKLREINEYFITFRHIISTPSGAKSSTVTQRLVFFNQNTASNQRISELLPLIEGYFGTERAISTCEILKQEL